jgi:hypothetical protein
MIMYQLLKDRVTNEIENIVKRTADNAFIPADNAFIPLDPDNTDYQEYLEWVAKGNKVMEADET